MAFGGAQPPLHEIAFYQKNCPSGTVGGVDGFGSAAIRSGNDYSGTDRDT